MVGLSIGVSEMWRVNLVKVYNAVGSEAEPIASIAKRANLALSTTRRALDVLVKDIPIVERVDLPRNPGVLTPPRIGYRKISR